LIHFLISFNQFLKEDQDIFTFDPMPSKWNMTRKWKLKIDGD